MSESSDVRRGRLWLEFLLFYIAAPAVLAVWLPPAMLFPLLFALMVLGAVLLHWTPGFAWRDLISGRVPWLALIMFTAITVAVTLVVMRQAVPEQMHFLFRRNPQLMLMIALLYPVLSAFPQEVIFRPLFFRRYAPILPGGVWAQIILNGALFSFAHLMYWNWIVAGMTFSGGLFFAWVYRVRGSFPAAVLAHAIAGLIVFSAGLGIFFYSGNVQRPF